MAKFFKIVAQHHFVLVADRLLRMGQMMLPWLYGLVETWLEDARVEWPQQAHGRMLSRRHSKFSHSMCKSEKLVQFNLCTHLNIHTN